MYLNAERSRGIAPVREATFLSSLKVQRRRLSAGMFFPFSDSWSFGADDQGRGAAVASAALRGDWEMLKDIFESN